MKTKSVHEVTALQYAIDKKLSLCWVYMQCRLGRLPARHEGRQWRITVPVVEPDGNK